MDILKGRRQIQTLAYIDHFNQGSCSILLNYKRLYWGGLKKEMLDGISWDVLLATRQAFDLAVVQVCFFIRISSPFPDKSSNLYPTYLKGY